MVADIRMMRMSGKAWTTSLRTTIRKSVCKHTHSIKPVWPSLWSAASLSCLNSRWCLSRGSRPQWRGWCLGFPLQASAAERLKQSNGFKKSWLWCSSGFCTKTATIQSKLEQIDHVNLNNWFVEAERKMLKSCSYQSWFFYFVKIAILGPKVWILQWKVAISHLKKIEISIFHLLQVDFTLKIANSCRKFC